MSKKIIIITCLICLSFSISAQTERGHWLLNPQFTAFDLSGTNNDLDKDNRFKLGMGFKGGNFLCDRLALLVGVGFKVDRQNDYKDNSINLNTGLRYYLFRNYICRQNWGTTRYGLENTVRILPEKEIIFISELIWDIRYSYLKMSQ